jgi:hypothetical protein
VQPQGKDGLDNLIKALTRGNNKARPKLDFVKEEDRTRYIRFLREFVYFLPGTTPEEFVWDEDAAQEILDGEVPAQILQEQDIKKRLHFFGEMIPGSNADVVFSNLLTKLLRSDNLRKFELMKIIRKIRAVSS